MYSECIFKSIIFLLTFNYSKRGVNLANNRLIWYYIYVIYFAVSQENDVLHENTDVVHECAVADLKEDLMSVSICSCETKDLCETSSAKSCDVKNENLPKTGVIKKLHLFVHRILKSKL